MNTGIQQSGATPLGAWTTTTPKETPKSTAKKDILTIMAAHGIPYFASASPAFPDDYLVKLERAKRTKGFRFLHLFTPCPPGQRFEEKNTVRVARKAITSRVFPLVEIVDGDKLTIQTMGEATSIKEYLDLQGRFAHFGDEQVERFAGDVQSRWEYLVAWSKRS
ncbi:NADH-dependent phenylglyoxylate dehydrogenase subunit beta [bacterium BMS3Bbin04]|nr:NADH-dependent phenylglyoxylate dehydrogenase subunit beta [bacterium BMS3Bbin04]